MTLDFSRVFHLGWFFVAVLLAPQTAYSEPRPGSIAYAFESLQGAPTGRELTQKALAAWRVNELDALVAKVKWAPASRTDTILTRQYNPQTGREERFREMAVFLKEDQSMPELVLDLAHELVHATSKPGYDPYDPTLTSSKYVWLAIEGEGGEVEAVLQECQVGLELAETEIIGKSFQKRCRNYITISSDGSRHIDRKKVVSAFYRVGKWFREVSHEFGKDKEKFPELSPARPSLYSSTGHTPYPFALLKEYKEINQAACENSRRRKAHLVVSSSSTAPDEQYTSSFSFQSVKNRLESFLSRRCRK